MVKKALLFASAVVTLVALVASFTLRSPQAKAQGLAPDPNQPNCYNVAGDGYQRVDCGQMGMFSQSGPLQPGQCYLLGGTEGGAPTVTKKDCNTITTGGSTTTPSTTTPTSRDDAINCDGKGDAAKLKDCLQNHNPLVTRFTEFIDFLGIGVGVVVVTMIIIGGIQYVTAGPNPQAVSAAKKRILNAVIALVAFLLLYSFMQWLVPGGIF